MGPQDHETYPCCHIEKGRDSADINWDPEADFLNQPLLRQMRSQALQGTAPELCANCLRMEQVKGSSPRTSSIAKFKNQGVVKPEVTVSDLEYLQVRLDNVCNFKCVICGPTNSHLIAREQGYSKVLTAMDSTRQQQIRAALPQMSGSIHIAGGEPFANKASLMQLLSQIPNHVHVFIKTNGSSDDPEIIAQLCRFDHLNIGFSIDGCENSFEYQRTNGKWPEVMANIISIKQQIESHGASSRYTDRCDFTVTCLNATTIPYFLRTYQHLWSIVAFHALRFPMHYRMDLVKPELLMATAADEVFNDRGIRSELITAAQQSVDPGLVRKFWSETDRMRQLRGIDIDVLIPDARNFIRDI